MKIQMIFITFFQVSCWHGELGDLATLKVEVLMFGSNVQQE
jgi:hypothetical protein